MTRRFHPDILEERRKRAIDMIRNGKRKAHVAEELGVSRAAVTQWWKEYKAGGKKALKQKKRSGRPPKIKRKDLDRLPELLSKGATTYGYSNDLWTTKRIAKLIFQEFGVKYHRDHVCKLLHELGMSWQKPKKRAIQRDEEAIQYWINKRWPVVKKTQ